MDNNDKKMAGQLLLLAVVIGVIILYRNDKKKKIVENNILPKMPNQSGVINPNTNTDNATPVSNFEVVKNTGGEVPVPDAVKPPQTVDNNTPATTLQLLEANLHQQMGAYDAKENNFTKATRFLTAKGIDTNTLQDSTPQGIVNYAMTIGWNPTI